MRPAVLFSALALCCALTACSGSEPPKDAAQPAVAQPGAAPPDATAPPAQPDQPSALRQAMQTPIDKTHAAEDATADAEKKRDDALNAAAGQ